MKKILSILMILVMSISLYSCKNEDTKTAQQPETEIEVPQLDLLELNVYNVDESMNESTHKITMENNVPMQGKMIYLASELSGKYFDGNRIEVGVNEEKNCAYINLKDEEGKEWAPYFQGSAGGKATEYKIVKTMLQPELEADWIDYIEIHYNNEPAFEKFDHFCLYEKFERDKIDEYYSE